MAARKYPQRVDEIRVLKSSLILAVKKAGKSHKQLAYALGIRAATLSRKLSEKNPNRLFFGFKAKSAASLAKLLEDSMSLQVLIAEYQASERSRAATGKKMKGAWSAYRQIVAGVIPRKQKYACERWKERVTIDEDGSVQKRVDATIVNISRSRLDHIAPPVFGDSKSVTPEDLAPCAQSRRKKLRIRVAGWVAGGGMGRFIIPFERALAPGDSLSFSYGHYYPQAYRTKCGWYSCNIAADHYDYQCELIFPRTWKIENVIASPRLESLVAKPVVNDNTIRWHVVFPRPGTNLKLTFRLVKDRKHSSRAEET